VQVDSVLAHNIVLGAWIREVVYLYIVLDALPDEAKAVLPYNDRVDRSLADKKLALEILGFIYQAGLLIAFRIGSRIVHISLSVHYFIPFPVDHRTSGYGHLDDVRIIGDK
jgi:hypothetical protein